ncbi:phospholipase A1 member A-like isoform X2 [Haematobia irritans]|uniref:phospholipase A1 member A-like isoform X2 n=1 Tax=Haematobia irritans TaxID=7368 RepID=UPI003F4F97E5
MLFYSLILYIITAIIFLHGCNGKNIPSSLDNESTQSSVQSKDIVIGSCIWAIERTCPDKDVSFHLYTRQNPTQAQLIFIDKDIRTSNLTQSFYDNRYPSKIIIHGYNANMFLHSLALMKDEYLSKGDYNIFYVDWSTLAYGPCYINAVYNIHHTGTCIAQLVERIRDLKSSDIHLIGFSLGAHITNYVSKSLGNFTLPRITDPFACFHHRALDYFHESIRSPRGFWGWPCTSYMTYLLGYCPRSNVLVEAGENVKTSTRGMFLVETNGHSPYAMGKWTTKNDTSKNASQLEIITESPRRSPPIKRIDPLLDTRDTWKKLDYKFNNNF